MWGDAFGLEHALWFADGPADAHEEPTFRRSRAHPYVVREVKAVREAVGMIEIANFAKHRFTGPDARRYLNRLMAGRVPKPGRIALSPMLSAQGKLYGDLTVACLTEQEFMVFGSGVAQAMHRRWFEQHLTGDVQYANASSHWHGIAIAGPKARTLLQRVCRDDVSNHALRFRDVRQTFVAGVPAILARLSFSGELGYEIYVAPEYQIKLYEALIAADAGELGLRPYGARALLSLRLEKNWGVWTLDFRPDFNAVQAGLDNLIDWDKDFIGKTAAQTQRTQGADQRLVTMTVDTPDIDVSNDEAILQADTCVGYVTSGGYAHTLGQSIALGYVPSELSADGTALHIEINGERYPAQVIAKALYDPDGGRMRG